VDGNSFIRTLLFVRNICGYRLIFFLRFTAGGNVQMSKSTSDPGKMKSNGSKESDGADRKPPEFVQYRLSEDEFAQAKEACSEFSDVVAVFQQFIAEGYKVSMSHDSYGGGVQVFATPVDKGSVNGGWTLSARAPTIEQACGVLAFKHYTLFDQVWPKDVGTRRGEVWG
jgi:hypothetical protein